MRKTRKKEEGRQLRKKEREKRAREEGAVLRKIDES